MPATKKPTNGSITITDEHIWLFKLAMAIREAGEHEPNVSVELHDQLGLALWDLPVTSDSVERDPVSWPVRLALEEAMAQEAAGRPVASFEAKRLSDTDSQGKRTSESPSRSRDG
jgi:hypothetical protein